MFLGVLISFYRAMREKLDRAIAAVPVDPTELALAKFGIGYLAAYLLYNVTEAIFQPLNFLFIVFLVLGMRYPRREDAGRTGRQGGAGTKRDLGPCAIRLQCAPVAPARNRERSDFGLPGPTVDRANRRSWPVANGGPPGGRDLNPAWTGERTGLWTPPRKRSGINFLHSATAEKAKSTQLMSLRTRLCHRVVLASLAIGSRISESWVGNRFVIWSSALWPSAGRSAPGCSAVTFPFS